MIDIFCHNRKKSPLANGMITYYQQKEGKGNDTNILCPTYLLVAVYTFVIDMSLSRSFFKAQKTIENVR